ncbi:MAG: type VI secretion system baseplate subunit TssE [Planctomycetaceae bacterium]|nr:type VI secretion system baseplate subunit TssE [Planctomycetaceae bacterium]
MANDDTQLRPSLIELLTDDNPRVGSESHVPGTRFKDVCQSLARDLTQLLNTRLRCAHWPEQPASSAHGLSYGLPDFSAADLNATSRNQQVAEWIRNSIIQHEPRLKSVVVEPVSSANETDRRLVFLIRAAIAMEPYEEVSFSSQFQSSTGAFGVGFVAS